MKGELQRNEIIRHFKGWNKRVVAFLLKNNTQNYEQFIKMYIYVTYFNNNTIQSGLHKI